MKIKLVLAINLIALLLISIGCSSRQSFDSQLGLIVNPYRFNLAAWEIRTLSGELEQSISANNTNHEAEDDIEIVLEYFSLVEKTKTIKLQVESSSADSEQGSQIFLDDLEAQKTALRGRVERILRRQAIKAFAQQGIFNPVSDKLETSFPPLLFKLEQPPGLLVVSPRDRIESMREVLLAQDIGLEETVDIESMVDELGVSSLVVPLGGIATYPSFVGDEFGLKFALDAVTEEWIHQYLFFKPLGLLYLLDLTGIFRNYDIVTINETLASMVSKEISSMIYRQYYVNGENDSHKQVSGTEFDFNREMRNIRREVDEYLARGEIEQAEKFMEQKRLYLGSKGYHIRKLNQAYFAFYGAYADSPTSISPIGLELKELREQAGSLKDFLNTVASMTGRRDLQLLLEKRQ